MQQQYNKMLSRFYQAHNSKKYITIDEEFHANTDSSDNEEMRVYMKSDPNDNGEFDDMAPMLDGSRKRKNKRATVKPVQPNSCCSKRTCVLLLIWTFLFLSGVLGLTFFIQQILVKVINNRDAKRDFVEYNEYLGVNHTESIVACDDFEITPIWHSVFDKLQTETAIRFIDVNLDGHEDVIVGFGTAADGFYVPRIVCDLYFNGTYPCFGGAMALDGVTGKEIWRHYSGHEIYAVNCNGDLNQDGIPDCLLGGRGGIFDVVNGKTGEFLWAFLDKNVQSTVMNLYTAQFIQDFNSDGVMEILQIHGGDPLA